MLANGSKLDSVLGGTTIMERIYVTSWGIGRESDEERLFKVTLDMNQTGSSKVTDEQIIKALSEQFKELNV